MSEIVVQRFAYTPVGTFGRIFVPSFQAYTVERPWLDNKPFVSCIPEGDYQFVLGKFTKGNYAAYEILDVPGRTLIKIHIANVADDVNGCVGIGRGLGFMDDRWAVTHSKETYWDMMGAMDGVRRGQIRIEHQIIVPRI